MLLVRSVLTQCSSRGMLGVCSTTTPAILSSTSSTTSTPSLRTCTAALLPVQQQQQQQQHRSFHASSTSSQAKKMNVEQLAAKVNLKDTPVLVRVDLNVPLDEATGTVLDDTRLQAVVPTCQFLLQQGAKVILCSHFGRPKGQIIETGKNGRLDPVRAPLEALLGVPVTKVNDCVGLQVEQAVASVPSGQVLLLENVRFEKGETDNDPALAQGLARLSKYFVNDAFGTAHRAHASTTGVCSYCEYSVAGYLLERELEFLQGAVLQDPKRPLMAIVGGAKVSTKLPVLESLLERCNVILLGGGMMFTFYKALGYNIGQSLVEEDMVPLAEQLMTLAQAKGVRLVLPTDVVLADAFSNDATTAIAGVQDIADGWRGMDIGPETIEMFEKEIAEANTIVWNGPSTFWIVFVWNGAPFLCCVDSVTGECVCRNSHRLLLSICLLSLYSTLRTSSGRF